MDSKLFFKIFQVNSNQNNYIQFKGRKFALDNFFKINLNYKTVRVTYEIEIEIPDTLLGRLYREKYQPLLSRHLSGDENEKIKLSTLPFLLNCSLKVTPNRTELNKFNIIIGIHKSEITEKLENYIPNKEDKDQTIISREELIDI